MRDSLDKLESQLRREANQRARLVRKPSILKPFAFGVVFTPGVLMGSMFIPIFGLLLAIAVLSVALIYAYLSRSLAQIAAATTGGLAIIVVLSILGVSLGHASNPILYSLLATCVGSDLIALIILGGAIMTQHEAGVGQQAA